MQSSGDQSEMREVLAVRRLFLDQELIPYRLSYCNWADDLQKAFIDSNRIGKNLARSFFK